MTTPELASAVPLADTLRPPLILTPELNAKPDQTTLALLEQRVERDLASEEVYTITNCDYVSPEGPNYLMTIKPYYWEVEPGKWEARDGYQNRKVWPSRQQKQLEAMSQTIYILCLTYRHLPELRSACLTRMEKLLQVFFVDDTTRMMPEAKYVQCVPSHTPMEGDHAFIISMRFLILVSRGLSDIPLSDPLHAKMREWSTDHCDFIRYSRPGERARACGDNKTFWYHAVLASHLTFIDRDEAKRYASDALVTTINKFPTPTQLFKREVNRTRPVHYALYTLEPLCLLAALTVDQLHASSPAGSVLEWLSEMVGHVPSISLGVIESERESAERTAVKLRWFQKMLARWRGEVHNVELDGSLWTQGWSEMTQLLWGFL